MSNVIIYNPNDTTVANRVSGYLVSVNTPDYTSNPYALINPDLSDVSGVAQKFWKVSDSTVVQMDSTDLLKVLPSDKTSEVVRLNYDADSYIDSHYSPTTSESINILYNEALSGGFSNRVDYIEPWRNWITDIREYENTVENNINDCTNYAMLNNVSWDFAHNFDSSNPDISLKGILDMTRINPEKNYKISDYTWLGKLQTETWYETDDGNGSYSNKAEETVYTYSGLSLIKKTTSVYCYDGSVDSTHVVEYYTNGNERIQKYFGFST